MPVPDESGNTCCRWYADVDEAQSAHLTLALTLAPTLALTLTLTLNLALAPNPSPSPSPNPNQARQPIHSGILAPTGRRRRRGCR